MSDLGALFDDELNADIGNAVGEQVRLHWPDWPSPTQVVAVVEEGYERVGDDHQIGADAVVIELAASALPAGATTNQLKQSLQVELLERAGSPRVYVDDRRRLGAGADQLIGAPR